MPSAWSMVSSSLLNPSICPSIHLLLYTAIYASISSFISFFLHLAIHLPIYPLVCLSIHPPIWATLHLLLASVYLVICLSNPSIHSYLCSHHPDTIFPLVYPLAQFIHPSATHLNMHLLICPSVIYLSSHLSALTTNLPPAICLSKWLNIWVNS